MKEQLIQKKIINYFESKGYYCLKLSKTNKNGIPDLLILKANETPLFIEVKTENGVVAELQKFRISELNKLGFKAFVAKNIEDVINHKTQTK